MSGGGMGEGGVVTTVAGLGHSRGYFVRKLSKYLTPSTPHSVRSSTPLRFVCGLRRTSVRVLAGATNGNDRNVFTLRSAFCAPARTRTQND